MANGKGIILAVAGLGGVALLVRAASAGTSAPSDKQQTYVEKTLAKATSATTAKGGKIDKAKTAVKKGTAEINAAAKAIDKLLS